MTQLSKDEKPLTVSRDRDLSVFAWVGVAWSSGPRLGRFHPAGTQRAASSGLEAALLRVLSSDSSVQVVAAAGARSKVTESVGVAALVPGRLGPPPPTSCHPAETDPGAAHCCFHRSPLVGASVAGADPVCARDPDGCRGLHERWRWRTRAQKRARGDEWLQHPDPHHLHSFAGLTVLLLWCFALVFLAVFHLWQISWPFCCSQADAFSWELLRADSSLLSHTQQLSGILDENPFQGLQSILIMCGGSSGLP